MPNKVESEGQCVEEVSKRRREFARETAVSSSLVGPLSIFPTFSVVMTYKDSLERANAPREKGSQGQRSIRKPTLGRKLMTHEKAAYETKSDERDVAFSGPSDFI